MPSLARKGVLCPQRRRRRRRFRSRCTPCAQMHRRPLGCSRRRRRRRRFGFGLAEARK